MFGLKTPKWTVSASLAVGALLFAGTPYTYAGGPQGPPAGSVLAPPISIAKLKVKEKKDGTLIVQFKGGCNNPDDPESTVDFDIEQVLPFGNPDFAGATAETMFNFLHGQVQEITQLAFTPCGVGNDGFVIFIHEIDKKNEKKFKADVVLMNFIFPSP